MFSTRNRLNYLNNIKYYRAKEYVIANSFRFVIICIALVYVLDNLFGQDDNAPLSDLLPSAVPVLTQEEAEEQNFQAKKYIEILQRKKDKSILEGRVAEISSCPNPELIDYPDCDLTVLVSLNDAYSSQIVLILPCIRNSKIISSISEIKKDSLIGFQVIEESNVTEEMKYVQISDDILDYTLDYRYAENIQLINYFSKISQYQSVAKKQNSFKKSSYTLSDKDIAYRKSYIEKELDRLNKIISNYSTNNAALFCEKYLKVAQGYDSETPPYARIQYDDGSSKIFPFEVEVPPERYLNSAFSNDYDKMINNANVISSVNDFLLERGILLIVIPFPQHFESFANRLNFAPSLSTYNINRVYFMRELLKKNVEVLDIEPMIEGDLESLFHYYLLFNKNMHPSEMGAYKLSEFIYEHLSQYDYFKPLIKNNYSIETRKTIQKESFQGKEFRDMESIEIANMIYPIDKDSPFLLVGDSFSNSGHIQYYIANALCTKINVINATSSFPNTARLLQQRSREISPNTRVCFLLNTSYDLQRVFLPFIDESIVLYPNPAFFPETALTTKGVDLQKEISISFDIDLSKITVDTNKYKLVFWISSTDQQIYELRIDSLPPQSVGTGRTGHGIIEYSLADTSHPLHITLSTFPDADGYPIRNNQNLSLTIEKIFLEEK